MSFDHFLRFGGDRFFFLQKPGHIARHEPYRDHTAFWHHTDAFVGIAQCVADQLTRKHQSFFLTGPPSDCAHWCEM